MRKEENYLPIPDFWEVKETHVSEGEKLVRLITPDLMAGHRARYSVVEIDREAGTIICIGRELDLKLSRRIAKLGLEVHLATLKPPLLNLEK